MGRSQAVEGEEIACRGADPAGTTVDLPHLVASSVAPKMGAVRKSADATQTQISSLCLAPDSLCFVHHTHLRCLTSFMDLVLFLWGSLTLG